MSWSVAFSMRASKYRLRCVGRERIWGAGGETMSHGPSKKKRVLRYAVCEENGLKIPRRSDIRGSPRVGGSDGED